MTDVKGTPPIPHRPAIRPLDRVRVSGTLTLAGAPPPGRIQIDVTTTPSTGQRSAPLGWVRIDGPGPFKIDVPRNAGAVSLTIYTGVNQDDPGGVDPNRLYTYGPLRIGTADLTGITLNLAAARPPAAFASPQARWAPYQLWYGVPAAQAGAVPPR